MYPPAAHFQYHFCVYYIWFVCLTHWCCRCRHFFRLWFIHWGHFLRLFFVSFKPGKWHWNHERFTINASNTPQISSIGGIQLIWKVSNEKWKTKFLPKKRAKKNVNKQKHIDTHSYVCTHAPRLQIIIILWDQPIWIPDIKIFKEHRQFIQQFVLSAEQAHPLIPSFPSFSLCVHFLRWLCFLFFFFFIFSFFLGGFQAEEETITKFWNVTHKRTRKRDRHCVEIYCEIKKPDDDDDDNDEKKTRYYYKIGMIWDREREREWIGLLRIC